MADLVVVVAEVAEVALEDMVMLEAMMVALEVEVAPVEALLVVVASAVVLVVVTPVILEEVPLPCVF